MFNEHHKIVLTVKVTEDEGEALGPGDVGVVEHAHPGGNAYVVDFLILDDGRAAIAIALPSQGRSFSSHARPAEIPA